MLLEPSPISDVRVPIYALAISTGEAPTSSCICKISCNIQIKICSEENIAFNAHWAKTNNQVLYQLFILEDYMLDWRVEVSSFWT